MAVRRGHVASLVLALAVIACAAQQASAATATGTLGSAVSVAANTETTISYTGFNLVVTLDAAGTVTLSSVASVTTSMPSGYTALAFTAQAGFEFSYTGGGSIVKAQLTTPPLTVTTAGLITGSVDAGCLRFDANIKAYSKVDITSYTAGTRTIVVDLPAANTYFFVAVSASAKIPTFYAEARATTSTSISLVFPEGFEMDVATTTNNQVTVARASSSTYTDPTDYHNVGAFFDISLTTEEAVTATLKYTYDASLSASIADDLKFASYSSGAWNFESSGGSVDTNTRVVSQTTTHFSQWGVFQNSDDDDGFSKSNQVLNPASPSKCYAVDYDHTLGVVNFNVKKVSGSGNLRMYLKKGTDCPDDGDYQMRSLLVTDAGASDTLCINSGTTPQASDGRFMVSVFAEGLSGVGSETKFDLTVRSALFCSASPVTTVLSLAALAILAAVAAMLA